MKRLFPNPIYKMLISFTLNRSSPFQSIYTTAFIFTLWLLQLLGLLLIVFPLFAYNYKHFPLLVCTFSVCDYSYEYFNYKIVRDIT